MTASSYLRRADASDGVDLHGFGINRLVPATATGGRVTVVDHTVPPRRLAAPLHVHAVTVEISVVVAGRIGVRIGDEEFEASGGDVVEKPAGVPHAFWNPTDETARLVELITPSGFEDYFAELAAIVTDDGFDMGRLVDVVARHDIELDLSSIDDLVRRHRLER